MRTLHVLIVDDNRLIRASMAMHFVDQGYRVTEAKDGNEALDCMRQFAIDVVLMDLQMPQMDGITATRLLRADPAFQAVPIFAFTGHPQTADSCRALFTGVLVKPIAPGEVLHAIAQWMDKTASPALHPSPAGDSST